MNGETSKCRNVICEESIYQYHRLSGAVNNYYHEFLLNKRPRIIPQRLKKAVRSRLLNKGRVLFIVGLVLFLLKDFLLFLPSFCLLSIKYFLLIGILFAVSGYIITRIKQRILMNGELYLAHIFKIVPIGFDLYILCLIFKADKLQLKRFVISKGKAIRFYAIDRLSPREFQIEIIWTRKSCFLILIPLFLYYEERINSIDLT